MSSISSSTGHGHIAGAPVSAHAGSDPATKAHDSRLPAHEALIAGMAAGGVVGLAVAAAGMLRGGSIRSVIRPMTMGMAVGGAAAGVAAILDRVTGNHLGSGRDFIVRNRHTIWMLMQHPTRPWIGSLGRRTYADAESVQAAAYGARHTTDDGGDAFRHAYGSAVFALRMMRDHGVSPEDARSIVIAAGHAHELDTWAGNTLAAHAMDEHNNAVGAKIAEDGRRADGTWLSENDIRSRVVDAVAGGQLQRLAPGSQSLIATGPSDLPVVVSRD